MVIEIQYASLLCDSCLGCRQFQNESRYERRIYTGNDNNF